MEIDLDREQYPLSPLGNMMELKDTTDVILEEIIIEQYEFLERLGINLINDQIVDITIFENILIFVNDNYLPIIHINTIFENSKQVGMIGTFVYEFICTDIINIILPQIMVKQDITDPTDLYSINSDSLKEFFFNIITSRCDLLKSVNQISSNVTIYNEFIKWLFYSDLIDNQIENFIENFLTPVIDKYDQELYSRALTSF